MDKKQQLEQTLGELKVAHYDATALAEAYRGRQNAIQQQIMKTAEQLEALNQEEAAAAQEESEGKAESAEAEEVKEAANS